MIRSAKVIIFMLLVFIAAARAASAAFEDSSWGARSRALGGAFSSIADDSEAVLAQPAGLPLLSSPEIALTYGKLYAGLSDESSLSDGAFTFGWPIGKKGGFGLGYKNLALRSMYSEETISGAFGWRVHPIVSAGVTLKYLALKYGSDDYTAADPVFAAGSAKRCFDLDCGVLVQPLPRVRLSAARRNNLGSDIGLKDQAQLPGSLLFGASYANEDYTVSLEHATIDARTRLSAGLEIHLIRKLLDARFGLGWGNSRLTGLASGIGFTFNEVRFDYAFDYPVSGLENTSGTHYVTLAIRLGRNGWSFKNLFNFIRGTPQPKTAAKPAEQAFQDPEITGPAAVKAPAVVPAAVIAPSTGTIAAVAVSTASAAAPELRPAAPKPAVSEPKPKIEKKQPRPSVEKEPEPAVRTHRVEAGDTLPQLAEKYYGSAAVWTKIYDANKDTIEKGSLQPGQLLIIPK